MFGFKKRKKPAQDSAAETSAQHPAQQKQGVLRRLKERLSRTRGNLRGGLSNLLLGRKSIDDDLLEELETLLLTADVGVEATSRIIEEITGRVRRKELADPEALSRILKQQLLEILESTHQPAPIPQDDKPLVMLMVGINGAGKTTSIGKLAHKFLQDGKNIMLAAGDTFRAAAVEQLQAWGERNNVQVVAQHTGADSASVIFDAVQAATARKTDILIADTAGRLHTKTNLMDELTKIARVMSTLR